MSFIVYDQTLQTLGMLKPLIDQVGTHDRSLADQLRRAGQSMCLNIAEGRSARGRNEVAKFQVALSECREARAALQIAAAWGYIEDPALLKADAALDQVAAMLWVLVHRPRRAA